MRYTQSRHYDQRAGGYVITTYMFLSCGHKAMYYGGIEHAEEAMMHLGITLITGISRCKECTGRYMVLQSEINTVSHTEAYLA